jgi:DNA-binding transcriptional MerR regulator
MSKAERRSTPAQLVSRRGRAGAAARDSRTAAASTSEETLSIGELASRTNVSARTIRYYEELGILPEPTRTSGGTRRYPADHIFYVEAAKILKQLGFGVEEIAELGKFALTGTSASKRTRAILQQRLDELNHRIWVLDRLHDLVEEAPTDPKAEESPVPDLLRWVTEEHDVVGPADPPAALDGRTPRS